MEYNLPRGYLSSSACDLWERDKNGFRSKYYLGESGFNSPYTDFGKHFADDMEKHPEKYPLVPRYDLPEFPLKWVVAGVPVLGYIDSFCPTKKAIIEYKTGIAAKEDTWNAVKVRKWTQLPFYAMVVRSMFGTYDPNIKLVWLKTEWGEDCKETKFGNQLIRECSNVIRLMDEKPVIFKRKIEEWELDNAEKRLVTIAEEVSKDYTQFLA